jgi:hypothetical protein
MHDQHQIVGYTQRIDVINLGLVQMIRLLLMKNHIFSLLCTNLVGSGCSLLEIAVPGKTLNTPLGVATNLTTEEFPANQNGSSLRVSEISTLSKQ